MRNIQEISASRRILNEISILPVAIIVKRVRNFEIVLIGMINEDNNLTDCAIRRFYPKDVRKQQFR